MRLNIEKSKQSETILHKVTIRNLIRLVKSCILKIIYASDNHQVTNHYSRAYKALIKRRLG